MFVAISSPSMSSNDHIRSDAGVHHRVDISVKWVYI